MKLRKKCQKRVRKDIVKNKKGISGRPFGEERFLGMLDLCGFPDPGNCFWEMESGTMGCLLLMDLVFGPVFGKEERMQK